MKIHPLNTDIVECPYNSNHKMRYTRLIFHLCKCPDEEANRDLYSICRYNWLHRVLHADLKSHEDSCPSNIKGLSDWPETSRCVSDWDFEDWFMASLEPIF